MMPKGPKEMTIHLHDESGYLSSEGRLLAAIRQVLTGHACEESEVTLALMSDEAVRSLNRQFRGQDRVTDVLSFPTSTRDGTKMAESSNYLGDIVIAYPYVQGVALKSDRSVEDWLLLLAVHGTLHLLGYTHDDEAAHEKMWQVQASVLADFGMDEVSSQEMILSSNHQEGP